MSRISQPYNNNFSRRDIVYINTTVNIMNQVIILKKTIGSVFIILVFSSLISGCNHAINNSVTNQEKVMMIDKNYLLAINTINNFLIAWLDRDYDKGVELLSKEAKNSVPQEDLRMFFSGLSNPQHQGFEVIGKEHVDNNKIRFQVWLYEYYTGETPPSVEKPKPYSIDVIQVNEDSWVVNNLPE